MKEIALQKDRAGHIARNTLAQINEFPVGESTVSDFLQQMMETCHA